MNKLSFNNGWEFTKVNSMSMDTSLEKSEIVNLPHTWYSNDDYYRGMAKYSKKLLINDNWKNVFIDVEAADQHAYVYVDNVLLTEHKGGYSAFRCQIPEEIYKGKKELEVSIYVTNALDETISPLVGDFTIFGGLYRGVNILYTEHDSYFDPCYYGTDGVIVRTSLNEDYGLVDIELHTKTKQDDRLETIIKAADGTIIYSYVCEIREHIQAQIKNPILWNGKKNPYLYTVITRLYSADELVDEKITKTGFRCVEIDPNNGLFLNNEHIRINGVSKHQDVGEKYSAVVNDDILNDFSLIDEIGANSIRLSHYQHSSFTYECADKKGYLIWAEIPMLKMTQNEELLDNAREQLKELILQNIHHPSIYCWGIQNEIGMFRDAPYMYEDLIKSKELVKSLDSQRLVSAANLYTVKFKSKLNETTDMIGYNVYFGWYYGKMQDYSKYLDKFHEARPNLAIGMSEYGVDCNIGLHSNNPQVKDYSEEYQALYHETVYKIFETKPYLWGSYVWNMFDFSSAIRQEGGLDKVNGKGLVTADRKIKKDAFYYYKAKWSKEKFVHICSKRFVNRLEDTIDIKVFTNCETATLLLNGRECIEASNNGNATIIFENIRLESQVNDITVISGDCSDSASFVKVKEEDKSYRLEAEAAGTSVKNWFLKDDDLTKEGFYSIKDTVNDLIENKDTYEILKKYIPDILEMILSNEDFPLGLALQSVINRAKPENLDINLFNSELNKIEVEY
ncbi:glycoside hydrolase family 2 protein [Lachnospira multipara]|uniref:Beta-galactosidase n=1 Tax=Lachnospira multipara TaxID=28051 RepID=A0A1H5TW13_9FIRM|nr:glycoside hydrolase family 2 TIM barrel-domain containing protein [Lachnospira multipara]SEF67052.1 beta-galactosidase [Lachnospira multipara]